MKATKARKITKKVKEVCKSVKAKIKKPSAPTDPILGGPLLKGQKRIDALKKFEQELEARISQEEDEFYANLPEDADEDIYYHNDGLQQILNVVDNAIWDEQAKIGKWR